MWYLRRRDDVRRRRPGRRRRTLARWFELRHVEFFQRRFHFWCDVVKSCRSSIPSRSESRKPCPFRAHQVVQEAIAGSAFLLQHAALAHAGVHQQTQGERQVGFRRSIRMVCGMAVLLQFEIVFGQVIDDLAVLSRTVANTLTTLRSRKMSLPGLTPG